MQKRKLSALHLGLAAVTLLLWLPAGTSAATITYDSQAAFDLAIGASVLDTYSAAAYAAGDVNNSATLDIHSDANMSAVLGETDYSTTSRSNFNMIATQPANRYCNGCNGTFRLTFTSTSVGSADGVYGVGFNFGNRGTPQYYATVTFGDGSVVDYALPIEPDFITLSAFFGITSDLLIKSIHFGLPGGGTTNEGLFAIDNLEIGGPSSPTAVPEPGSLLLLASGLAGAIRYRRARRLSGISEGPR